MQTIFKRLASLLLATVFAFLLVGAAVPAYAQADEEPPPSSSEPQEALPEEDPPEEKSGPEETDPGALPESEGESVAPQPSLPEPPAQAEEDLLPEQEGFAIDGAPALTCRLGDEPLLLETVGAAPGGVIAWSSGDPAVAEVDTETGVVTPQNTGTATITATSRAEGYADASASLTLTVEAPLATKITLRSTLTLNRGQSTRLTATVAPGDAAQAVNWSSANSKVARVDANGRVTAIAKGSTNVTATATDGSGVIARCTVTVRQLVTKLTPNVTIRTVRVKRTCQLRVRVLPTTANNKAVQWKSSNPQVARVSRTGKVKGIRRGRAIITATARDGSKVRAKITLYVGEPVKSVTLSKTIFGVKKGKAYRLKATIAPKNAVRKTLTWKSSNPSVAIVNSKGRVKGLKKGRAVITATTTDGTKRVARATVYVNAPVKSIKLNNTTLTLNRGAKYRLKVYIKPSYAADKTIRWYSSNKKVAIVGSRGQVKAVGAGRCTITAKSRSGKKISRCVVRVLSPPPLFNYANYIPAGYPLDLVNIGYGQQMQRGAADAFLRMQAAAAAEGISLVPVSGYRSHQTQVNNYNNSIRRYLAYGYDAQTAVALTQRYYAIPGTSEHEAGLAIDINSVQGSFEQTPAFRWMQQHGSSYGFILRYKQGTEHITHIAYEPWHYRYVGVTHAKAIERKNITLEEYVRLFK